MLPSLLLHGIALLFFWQLAVVAGAPDEGHATIRCAVAEAPPAADPEKEREPLPSPTVAEPMPATLPEETPREETVREEPLFSDLPELRAEPLALHLPSRPVLAARRRARPKPTPPVTSPPPVRPVEVRIPAPTGPTHGASVLAGNREPAYPRRAALEGIEGVVVLRVTVGPDGRPVRVRIGESSGHPLLDRAAQKAVAAWRFQPALRHGAPIEDVVEVPVRFRLR